MASRNASRFAGCVLSVAFLSGALSAATWTVCPAAGGCNFTNIQAAIQAASPGDTILVFAGTYPPFVLDKPLRILGVGPNQVTVSMPGIPYPAPGTAHVTGLPAESFAVLAGMRVRIDSSSINPIFVFCLNTPPTHAALSISNCAGAVVLSNLEVDPGLYHYGVKADASALVLADHVTVQAPPYLGCSGFCCWTGAYPTSGCVRPGISLADTNLSLNASFVLGPTSSIALQAAGNSQSVLGRSALRGANGITVLCCWDTCPGASGTPGGHGLAAQAGASVRVAGGGSALVRGGNGAPGSGLKPCGCCPSGDGGHAVTASASTVLLDPGVPLLPGPSGGATPSCPALSGQAINGSTVTISPHALPSFELTPSLLNLGGTASFLVQGEPLAGYFVGASLAPGFLPVSGAGGPLLLDPAMLLVAFSGTLDAAGSAAIPISVPPDPLLSTMVLLFQPATLHPVSGAVDLGAAGVLVVL